MEEEHLCWYSATATKSKMDILMFQQKVILANLLQMRKRAHHRAPQLSNYHVCNFQFKNYFGSCVLGVSSECQAMRKRAHHRELQLSNYHVCNFQFKNYFGSCVFGGFRLSARLRGFCRGLFFFIPLCIHFWCVSDVALYWNKCLTTIKLTKKWLTSPIEAFHVEKSPKKETKVFAEGIFFVSCGESFFLARAAKNCPKNMPAKFQGCANFVPGVFSKRSLNDDGQTFFFLEVFP